MKNHTCQHNETENSIIFYSFHAVHAYVYRSNTFTLFNGSNFQLLMFSEVSSQKQMTTKVEQTDLEKHSREMAEGTDPILKHTKLTGS